MSISSLQESAALKRNMCTCAGCMLQGAKALTPVMILSAAIEEGMARVVEPFRERTAWFRNVRL